MIVLSHFQAKELLQNRGKSTTVEISTDLEVSKVQVELDGEGVSFANGGRVDWASIAEISESENSCYRLEGGEIEAIQTYSDSFERMYSLYPTESAPTMLVSGIPMHRIKGTDPWRDTHSKLKALGRAFGHVLDTTTGLGYTAILAAKTADKVTTIELDPAAQTIARSNPWSQALFENDKINQVIGDSYDEIEIFEDQRFNAIIHDPPMFSLAGDLYSQAFYQQAFRVLKPNGHMFHYIGNPESKSGSRVTQGVVSRLKKAGFSGVIPKPGAFGVLAIK